MPNETQSAHRAGERPNRKFATGDHVSFNRNQGLVIETTPFGVRVRWPDLSTQWISLLQMAQLHKIDKPNYEVSL